MKDLNKLRLLAGVTIDSSIELSEARQTPVRRSELSASDIKNFEKKSQRIGAAMKHLSKAIAALDKIPATDFSGDVPHFINKLEYVLGGDDGAGGLSKLDKIYIKELKAATRAENARAHEEEEELEKAATEEISKMEQLIKSEEEEEEYKNSYSIGDDVITPAGPGKIVGKDKNTKDDVFFKVELKNGKIVVVGMLELKGPVSEGYYYVDANKISHEDDEEKPVNVSDGSSNGEQVWDDQPEDRDESPSQLSADDSEKIKVPADVIAALKTEMAQAKKEGEKLDVHNKEAGFFYKDLARVYGDLITHLEGGTVMDLKHAQVYWSTLMGPMLHKIPKVVQDFIVNGGKKRSLRDYMKEVKTGE